MQRRSDTLEFITEGIGLIYYPPLIKSHKASKQAKTQLFKPGSQVHWVILLITFAGLKALIFP